MSMQVVAVITAKPGSEDAVRDGLKSLTVASREEGGCQSYALHESATTPGTFITVEEWGGPEDLDAHMQTPHVQEALSTLGDHLAEAPAVHPLQPIDA